MYYFYSMKNANTFMDKILLHLGKSNDSEIVTASLAAFKLIFIPIATMSDKKTSKKQKEYAIKRDFITECVALAGYLGITKAIKNNLTGPICAKYYKEKAKTLIENNKLNINDDDYNSLLNVDPKTIKKSIKEKSLNQNEKSYLDSLENIAKRFSLQNPKDLYLNTKKTISHVCVCLLALTIIPMITNKIIEIYSRKKPIEEDTNNKFRQKNYTTIKPMSIKHFANNIKTGGLNVFNH